jgi:hypothetical protein
MKKWLMIGNSCLFVMNKASNFRDFDSLTGGEQASHARETLAGKPVRSRRSVFLNPCGP